LFLISDEKVIDELCHQKARSKTDIDYLAEPKPLINCLVSSTQRSPKRRSSFSSSFESKQRSKSVNSHFSPSSDTNVNKQKTDQEESDNIKDQEENSNNTNNDEAFDNEGDSSDTSNKINKSNSNDFETKTVEDSSSTNNANENLVELIKPLNFDHLDAQNTNLSNSASFSENITDDEKYRQITSNSFSSNKING
jgi:hypothetical protein